MDKLNLIFFVATTVILGGAILAVQMAKHFAVLSQIDDDTSRFIPYAASSSVFVPHFDRYVDENSVIYLPSGDGLYMMRFKRRRNLRYRSALDAWLRRGATIHIMITCGSEKIARELWRPLKNLFPNNLHVHFLDRTKVQAGDDAADLKLAIERLDTFHAVILLNSRPSPWVPGAMWIETNHPVSSKFAEGISFVKPEDASKDERLAEYEDLYKRLLSGPQATELVLEASTYSITTKAA